MEERNRFLQAVGRLQWTRRMVSRRYLTAEAVRDQYDRSLDDLMKSLGLSQKQREFFWELVK